jgi:multiple sugar transport system substrate-binding protein
VRTALSRDDVWGVGLAMSVGSVDTGNAVWQFIDAYEADYVTSDGRLVIDDPEVRRKLIKAVDSYTAIYRKGCTPPGSVTWDGYGNNQRFLAQTIVMTPNQTLSIPNALRTARPGDYYQNAVTIDWPDGAYGQPLPIETSVSRAVAFKDGGRVATAKEFVSFLIGEGWLAHYLDFAGERILPPMPALLQAPFWLDPGDPHRMRSAMQLLTRPRAGSPQRRPRRRAASRDGCCCLEVAVVRCTCIAPSEDSPCAPSGFFEPSRSGRSCWRRSGSRSLTSGPGCSPKRSRRPS